MRFKVLFSTPKKWNPLSALTRWGTESKASHCALEFYSSDFFAPMVIEAHSTGFRIISAKEFYDINVISDKIKIELDQKQVSAMVDMLGDVYDFSGLFGMAIVVCARRLGVKKVENCFQKHDALFCSEAIALLVSMAGEHLEIEASTCSPEDLRRALHARISQ